MTHKIELIGKRFGRLTVVRQARKTKNGRHYITRWICKCDCGRSHTTNSYSLRKGIVKSCGCLRVEKNIQRFTSHGLSQTPEYKVWAGMKTRCGNSVSASFGTYGGRGIKVCKQWINDFAAFYRDVGPRPSERHSLERKKNSKGYEPGNVKWATAEEQANNRRSNVFYDFYGTKMTVRQALKASLSIVPFRTARARVTAGWSMERAVSVPVNHLR